MPNAFALDTPFGRLWPLVGLRPTLGGCPIVLARMSKSWDTPHSGSTSTQFHGEKSR